MISVMIVDDDDLFARSITRIAEAAGLEVSVANSAEQALRHMEQAQPDLAFVDIGLPGMSGIDLVKKLSNDGGQVRCVMVSGQTNFQTAVDAMRAGALDFIPKTSELSEIEFRMDKAVEVLRLRRHFEYLQSLSPGLDQIIGTSPPMRRVTSQISDVARTPRSTVLILGETGTGKELVAKAIHKQSDRREKAFVPINCSAIPEQLVESEFFGHEQGAFTGADHVRRGLVEVADQGTLFLDELGEMSKGLQAKLLRLIEERSFRRVGCTVDRRVDVRFIAASHRDLSTLAAEGQFREDLLYRLNVFQIRIPPLRERGRDVLLLSQHFIETFNKELRKQVRGMDENVERALLRHPLRGNVRQLRNFIEQAMISTRSEVLSMELFPGLKRTNGSAAGHPLIPTIGMSRSNGGEVLWSDLERQQNEAAREVLSKALDKAKGNKSKAARSLGISRFTLNRRLRQLAMP